jgi:hypothetical protein
MVDLIESPDVLRRCLGNSYNEIKRLDVLHRSRKDTAKFRGSLLERFGHRCGYCGEGCASRELHVAHIIPLRIGGLTDESNLILLGPCCHGPYDNDGCVSILAMAEVASELRAGRAQVRSPLRDRHLRVSPPDRLEYRKETLQIEAQRIQCTVGTEQSTILTVRLAEMARRRAGVGMMEMARKILEGIPGEHITENVRARYFYELGYVHRLLGYHEKAARFMRYSAHACAPGTGHEIAALSNGLTCEMATETNEEDYKERFPSFSARIANLLEASRHLDREMSERSQFNCVRLWVLACLRAGSSSESWRMLDQLRSIYYRWDSSGRWSAAARCFVVDLEGLVRSFFPRDANELTVGIELLTRAFITRCGNRQRPEGLRDVGMALAISLRKDGRKSMCEIADCLQALMMRTVDGTSVIWPWRANHSARAG